MARNLSLRIDELEISLSVKIVVDLRSVAFNGLFSAVVFIGSGVALDGDGDVTGIDDQFAVIVSDLIEISDVITVSIDDLGVIQLDVICADIGLRSTSVVDRLDRMVGEKTEIIATVRRTIVRLAVVGHGLAVRGQRDGGGLRGGVTSLHLT